MSLASAGTVVNLTTEAALAAALRSPLLTLINICWAPCGFCQALEPDWKRLAKRLRHEVVVAYWDAEAVPSLPAQLGTANSTPTIRALVPSPDAAAPRLVDYSGQRNLAPLLQFAISHMPDHVVRISSLADWYGMANNDTGTAPQLPRLLCFLGMADSAPTPPLLKALSASFHGKVRVAEARVHETAPAAGAELAASFGVNKLPSFVAVRSAAVPHWNHEGAPTFRRLREFAQSLADAMGGSRDEAIQLA